MINFALKGDILYTKNKDKIQTYTDSYLVCIDGKCDGIYKKLPSKYRGIKVHDYKGKMIVPGLVDMHLHAPQYQFIGLHMDLKLLDWLNKYTFPEEAKYKKIEYAKEAYDLFVDAFKKTPTTRFAMFATIHNEATLYLMKKLEKIGFKGYVGKVNMDRNSPKYLIEKTQESLKNTIKWLDACKNLKNIKPIITPRFIPSCTDDLMIGLSKIVEEYNLPIQSHLSENVSEIKWVQELVKKSKSYEHAYDMFNMFGNVTNTIMAHYVWPDKDGYEIVKKRKVWIAHSPSSNRNIGSGIAPIGKYLEDGIHVGLATDVSGGSYLSLFRAMEDAITSSKIRNTIMDKDIKTLNIANALYIATKGGGTFFGKVGSFEKGYEFDAVVIDDSHIPTTLYKKLSLTERFERFVYRPNDKLVAKFISGKKII